MLAWISAWPISRARSNDTAPWRPLKGQHGHVVRPGDEQPPLPEAPAVVPADGHLAGHEVFAHAVVAGVLGRVLHGQLQHAGRVERIGPDDAPPTHLMAPLPHEVVEPAGAAGLGRLAGLVHPIGQIGDDLPAAQRPIHAAVVEHDRLVGRLTEDDRAHPPVAGQKARLPPRGRLGRPRAAGRRIIGRQGRRHWEAAEDQAQLQ